MQPKSNPESLTTESEFVLEYLSLKKIYSIKCLGPRETHRRHPIKVGGYLSFAHLLRVLRDVSKCDREKVV